MDSRRRCPAPTFAGDLPSIPFLLIPFIEQRTLAESIQIAIAPLYNIPKERAVAVLAHNNSEIVLTGEKHPM